MTQSKRWSNPTPGDHPRPELLAAAQLRRPARLADGRSGRVQWINRAGTRLKLLMPEGYHVTVKSGEVELEDEPPP